MAAKVEAITSETKVWPFVNLIFASAVMLFALVPLAFAQEQAASGVEPQLGTVESRTVIGLEPVAVGTPRDPVMLVLFERQQRLEDALFVLEDRINDIAEIARATESRLARGDEPLVALEIEQLWVQIRSLEQENALLRDTLEARSSGQGD